MSNIDRNRIDNAAARPSNLTLQECERGSIMPITTTLRAQAAFFFLLVPRLVVGQCTPSRLAGYAFKLTDRGSPRLGAWCWNRVLLDCARDEASYDALLDICVGAGQYDIAEQFANRIFDVCGLRPSAGIRLVANFALSGAYTSALNIYDRLIQECGDDVVFRSPAPAWSRPFNARDYRSALISGITNTDANVSRKELVVGLARLCFSYGVFDTSAELFAKSRVYTAPEIHDRIAESYALSQDDRAGEKSLGGKSRSAVLDPDWRTLRASVLFACGDTLGAGTDVSEALRVRFQGHAELDRMIADCKDIVTALAACPATIRLSTSRLAISAPIRKSGLRKIFICGNGWTGSGAVYDALTEYDRLAEMPEAPDDDFLNDCTGNETMFVEGPSGLGHIWRTARQQQVVRRSDLWRLFRCHVLGAGAIGNSEHKSCRATSHLKAVFGASYTGVFCSMFKAFTELRDESDVSMLYRILNAAAESLATVFAGDHPCIVFNNAVFGRNIDMLEIFSDFKVAAVVRDPLDTYADRKGQDVNHWMKPARFVPFYRSSRLAIQSGRSKLAPDQADAVREVAFERFVLDEAYRRTVIDWLLEEQQASRIRTRFEPAKSALNVGMHTRQLSSSERTAIEKELRHWRCS
jgi:hypothetical protein